MSSPASLLQVCGWLYSSPREIYVTSLAPNKISFGAKSIWNVQCLKFGSIEQDSGIYQILCKWKWSHLTPKNVCDNLFVSWLLVRCFIYWLVFGSCLHFLVVSGSLLYLLLVFVSFLYLFDGFWFIAWHLFSVSNFYTHLQRTTAREAGASRHQVHPLKPQIIPSQNMLLEDFRRALNMAPREVSLSSGRGQKFQSGIPLAGLEYFTSAVREACTSRHNGDTNESSP